MSVIEDYFATIQEPRRAVLAHIAAVVKESVPEAQECTSYNMPAFRYKGKVILGFLAWKNHLALYPFSGKVADEMRDQLKGFKVSAGNGAIHFSETNPIPDEVLREIIRRRIEHVNASSG